MTSTNDTQTERIDPDQMAVELSALMDNIEEEDYQGSSDDGDPRMVRIQHLAHYLLWFYPEKLDKRFTETTEG